MKISVIGAGGWGTTLANLIAEEFDVNLWIREHELFEIIKNENENEFFLPGVRLNDRLTPINNIEQIKDSDVIVFAVPSQFMREIAKKASDYIKDDAILINLAKGLEIGTDKRMTQVLEEETGNKNLIALSGPNHAEEVSRKIPTATVIASDDKEILKRIKPILERDYFKVYFHDDVIGVEICGAIKNITAIATGICDGLGLGDNSKGSIITLGLSEMSKFANALGAKRKTVYGLAGVGDMVATCTSKHSRNRFFGEEIGKGKTIDKIKEELGGKVVEGVTSAKAVYEYCKKNDIEVPLTKQVYQVLYKNKNIKEAIKDLLTLL